MKCFLLFLRAALYVGLTTMNVALLLNKNYAGMFSTSAFLSYLWTHNVKSLAFSDERQRVSYALGAGVGCILGFWGGDLWK